MATNKSTSTQISNNQTVIIHQQLIQKNAELTWGLALISAICLFLLWKWFSLTKQNNKNLKTLGLKLEQRCSELHSVQVNNKELVNSLEAQRKTCEMLMEEAKKRDEYSKGLCFEVFLVKSWDAYNKQNGSQWVLSEWRGDKYIASDIDNENGLYATSNRLPDLQFTHSSGVRVAVECKYRSRMFDDKGIQELSYGSAVSYKYFVKTHGIPTFLVYGEGKTPEQPTAFYVYPYSKEDFDTVKHTYKKKRNGEPLEFRALTMGECEIYQDLNALFEAVLTITDDKKAQL